MNQQEAWEREYSLAHAIPTTVRSRPSSAVVKFEAFLRKVGLKNLSILDVGSGGGRNSIFLANQGHEVTAIDFAESGLALLRQKIASGSLSNQIRVLQHDLNRPLPFEDNAFDAAIDVTTTTSLTPEALEKLLTGLRRVIKPDGYLVTYIHSKDDGYLRAVAPNQNYYEVDDSGIVDYAYSEQELRAQYDNWHVVDLQHIEKKDILCGQQYLRCLWFLVCRNQR